MEADDASDAGDNVSDVVPSPDPPRKPKTFPTCDVPGWTVSMDALEKLRHFPILDTDDDNIVNCLKDTWSAYQRIISTFVGEMNKGPGKKDGGDWNDILTYHYRLYLKVKDEVDGERTKKRCQHCVKVSNSCTCNEKLMCWWKAAALVALVQPSSGAAERVFSLLKNLFGQKQTRLLSETIYLALFLAFNGRV